jgi:hypothetical protein
MKRYITTSFIVLMTESQRLNETRPLESITEGSPIFRLKTTKSTSEALNMNVPYIWSRKSFESSKN